MTYVQLVEAVARRLGGIGTLQRFLEGEVDSALNEAQMTVYYAYATAAGLQGAADAQHETEALATETLADGSDIDVIVVSGHRSILTAPTNPIAAGEDGAEGTTSELPDYYHLPIAINAAMILRQTAGDAAPRLRDPQTLEREYAAALAAAHQMQNMTLQADKPNRVMDGVDPYRHYREEF